MWYHNSHIQMGHTQALTENRTVCRSQRKGAAGLGPAVVDVPEALLVDPAEKSNTYSKAQAGMQQRTNKYNYQDMLHC